MDTYRIDSAAALTCDEALMACLQGLPREDPLPRPVHWRIALLGTAGRVYRVFELGGFGQYVPLVEVLRSFGFCHALPCEGFDEAFVQLWPASSSVSSVSPNSDRLSRDAANQKMAIVSMASSKG